MSKRYESARASWLAAKAKSCPDDLPSDLLNDLQALRDAGLTFTINPCTPAPPRPAREILWSEVRNLDAADPMRTLYQYQRSYSVLGLPVPPEITENLRAAYRDRQKARQRPRSSQT